MQSSNKAAIRCQQNDKKGTNETISINICQWQDEKTWRMNFTQAKNPTKSCST